MELVVNGIVVFIAFAFFIAIVVMKEEIAVIGGAAVENCLNHD